MDQIIHTFYTYQKIDYPLVGKPNELTSDDSRRGIDCTSGPGGRGWLGHQARHGRGGHQAEGGHQGGGQRHQGEGGHGNGGGPASQAAPPEAAPSDQVLKLPSEQVLKLCLIIFFNEAQSDHILSFRRNTE